MRELLPLFPKPSHYVGIEDGACVKSPKGLTLRIALAFPDTYEVGMSYLGQKILYGIVNENPRWWAERVMAPEREVAAILRQRNVPLSTLESDTPLSSLNAVCFSITHELCYTDVLHMLDLAHIPLRSSQRGNSLADIPLVIAGGGAMLGAEPLTPFLDLVALGDGEEILPEILTLLERALDESWSRSRFLRESRHIPGVYVPSLFHSGPGGELVPEFADYRPARRIVADLNLARYPASQVVPVGAVHNRLALEIARGCPRGCRFCHAGMVYRPARERNIDEIEKLLNECLDASGFEEVSFLALSSGDYTGLRTLYENVFSRCAREQITLSLPSLRAGSVSDGVMAKMASLRRTGSTMAPEAGSQRLRDVINNGISEEDILGHARMLLAHGWRQVKLYFMIGLPTETDEDLAEIANICRKVRDAGGPGSPRLQVTAALSPFVPKPFTPFQWAPQIGRQEIDRRVKYVLDLFKKEKSLSLRWHAPDVSHLEGILSRGGRELADVIEKAYAKGAIFCGWTETFELAPWLEALAECGMDIESLIGSRSMDMPLPWQHIDAGISDKFLRSEWQRASSGRPTPPCSPTSCRQCGVCDTPAGPSSLPRTSGQKHSLRLADPFHNMGETQKNIEQMPQHAQPRPQINPNLTNKAAHYRIWHLKMGRYAFLSQLELQALLMRLLRRAKIPVSFSQGFHPMPLISFGRALPVGLQSAGEWFSASLHTHLAPGSIMAALNRFLPQELSVRQVEIITKDKKTSQAISESFSLGFGSEDLAARAVHCFMDFCAHDQFIHTRQTKKGPRELDIRPLLRKWKTTHGAGSMPQISFYTDWDSGYLSPLMLVKAILASLPQEYDLDTAISIIKTGQFFEDGHSMCANHGAEAHFSHIRS